MKTIKTFNACPSSGNPNCITKGNGVQLLVSNLEPSVGLSEWRRILFAHFQAVIPNVYQIIVHRQSEGGCYAIVKLSCVADAQLAIMQLNRRKIGFRRIRVSMLNSSYPHVQDKQKKIISKQLLSAPDHVPPADTFVQQFGKKLNCSISLSELHKMRDVVEFRSSFGRRTDRLIALTESIDPPKNSDILSDIEDPLCIRHRPSDPNECHQLLNQLCLPRVRVNLATFRQNVKKVLQDHGNQIPVLSFTRCYEAQWGPFMKEEDMGKESHTSSETNTEQKSETTSSDMSSSRAKDYVSLEHLLTCVHNVVIQTSTVGIRVVILQESSEAASLSKLEANTPINELPLNACGPAEELQANSALNLSQENIRQLRREVVELIKMQPDCELLLSKFIPTYHSQFGKQCRLADYGFSRLQDIIDGLKGVVHVVGEGPLRTVMLTHNIQVRRFTHELLRLLKSEMRKSCLVCQLSDIYKQAFHKEFVASNYGMCSLQDLLLDISETTITTTDTGEGPMVVIPKRVQTTEQQERTRMFAVEVVNMLSSIQRFQIAFTKFIPAYHHAFNRQCRVSEYGFVKLIELLEALPDVVEVKEENNEKFIVLTNKIQMKILKEMLLTILELQPSKQLPIIELGSNFLAYYRLILQPEDYGFASLENLVSSFPEVCLIQVSPASTSAAQDSVVSLTGDGPNGGCSNDESRSNKLEASTLVCLANRGRIKQVAHRCLQLLFSSPFGSTSEEELKERYRTSFEEELDFELVQQQMGSFIHVSEYIALPATTSEPLDKVTEQQPSAYQQGGSGGGLIVSLCPLILFARQLRSLLMRTRGRLMLAILEAMYRRHFGVRLSPEAFGYPSLLTLVGAVSFVAVLRGRGARATLFLSQDYLGKLAWMISYNVVFRHQLFPDHRTSVPVLQAKFVGNPSPIPQQYDYYSPLQMPMPPGLSGHNWPYVHENEVLAYPFTNETAVLPIETFDYSTQDPMAMQKCATPFYIQNPITYPPITTPNPGLMIGIGPPTPELSFGQPPCFDYNSFQQPLGDLVSCASLMNKCKATPMIPYYPQQFSSPSLCLRDSEQAYAISAGAWPAYDQTGQYIQFNTKPHMPCSYVTPYCFKPLPMMTDALVPSTQSIQVPSGYPLGDSNTYLLQQGQPTITSKQDELVEENKENFQTYPIDAVQHWLPQPPPTYPDPRVWNTTNMVIPSWSTDQANVLWNEWQNPTKPPSLQGWPPANSTEETREGVEPTFSQTPRRPNTGDVHETSLPTFVNKCEEGDWTLPISMTTESLDSNSKEIDDTGSLEGISQTHV